MSLVEGRGDTRRRDDYSRPLTIGGGSDGAKHFARPITSESDDTPATHAAGALGWFKPEHGPAHDDAGDPKGSPKEAWPLVECPENALCELWRSGGDWYAEPVGRIEVRVGKPDADIAKGASGTVSVWNGEPGSESDTSDNVTAYAKARAVTSGKFVTLTRLPGNTGWYVDCWED